MSIVIGKFEPNKAEFRWKIENFSSLMSSSVGTYKYSPEFVTCWTDLKNPKWKLKLYPGGRAEDSKDQIGLYVVYLGETDVTVDCVLSAFNENGKIMSVNPCLKANLYHKGEGWGYNLFLKKKCIMDEGKNMLVNDVLIISCTISVPSFCEVSDDDKASAFAYFEELLENGKFTDVKFVLGRRRLLLHKAILTSISPVFQAMFEHDMKEKKENVVKITDIKYEVALELFKYIYCRKVNDIDSIAEDLLVAADKYAITGLKILCERSIINRLSVDNVLKCLLLVTTYETTHLKPKVVEFIMNHIKELIDTPEYNELDMQCKDEIIKALANK